MSSGSARSRLYYVALLAIVLLAAGLRMYGLKDTPPGFFCDEAGNGYNAYSLLETGRDENGVVLPLFIWSFGVAYKNPVYIYSAIGPIAVFGLDERGVRLTSAIFGVLAVLGIALVGRQMGGEATGLLSALTLAVCPWHLHFSRIAFELIAFPTILLFAFAALIAGVRARPRLLPVAGALFSLCLYTYGPAKLFVPLFVLAAALLYFRRLWALLRWTMIAAVVAAAVAAPVVVFDVIHRDRSQQYIRNTTSWQSGQSLEQNLRRFGEFYAKFFEPRFLFEQGDPLVRHAVPGFGELPWALAPLLAFGVLWALWPKNPEGKLLLWWLALYPIAPSLMNEIPSASRGFIGAAGFCLLAGCGAGAVLAMLRRLLRRPLFAVPVQAIAVAALVLLLAQETWSYWRAYTTTYTEQAAESFQYGYRAAIDFMEKRRGDYDLMLLTANDVNQPQIFAAFYRPVDPTVWQKSENSGYLIVDPSEFDRYRMDQRILAALREEDLRLFDEYNELTRVLRPDGRVEYVIAEPKVRRRFLRRWLLLGPFPNSSSTVDPTDVSFRPYAGMFGPTYWRRTTPQFVDVNLNDFYGRTAERAGRPLSGVCAWATTQVNVPAETKANLEVYGAGQLRGWVNGRPFGGNGVRLARKERLLPLTFRRGWNELLLQICKHEGEWKFSARLVGEGERDLPNFRIRARPAAFPAPIGNKPEEPQQVVNGMGGVVSFEHQSDLYADYRGDSRAWWEHLGDQNGALEWKTAPLPEKKATAVVFTANVGEAPGRADLYVDGHYTLTFSTGRFREPQRWQRGAFVLEYKPEERGHWTSGPWRLLVPAAAVTPGQPLTLRVAHRSGGREAFFMIKDRSDTAMN